MDFINNTITNDCPGLLVFVFQNSPFVMVLADGTNTVNGTNLTYIWYDTGLYVIDIGTIEANVAYTVTYSENDELIFMPTTTTQAVPVTLRLMNDRETETWRRGLSELTRLVDANRKSRA